MFEFDFRSYILDCVNIRSETFMPLRNDDKVEYYKFNADNYKARPELVGSLEYPELQYNIGIMRGMEDVVYYLDPEKKALVFKEL